jgi:hypothetical protein
MAAGGKGGGGDGLSGLSFASLTKNSKLDEAYQTWHRDIYRMMYVPILNGDGV